jgi:hypothetical protein
MREEADLDALGEDLAVGVASPGDRIPTLVLTANLDHTVAARATEAGTRGALSKVVSAPETAEAIKRLTGAG